MIGKPDMNFDKKKIFIMGVFAVNAVVLITGIWCFISLCASNASLASENAAMRAEIDDLSTRLKANFPADDEVLSVSGKVKEVREGALLVETEVMPELPPLPRELWPTEILTVSFNSDTEFVVLDYVYDSEGVPTPKETKIFSSDMRASDDVIVTAAANIKGLKSFAAVKVTKEKFMDANEGKGDGE